MRFTRTFSPSLCFLAGNQARLRLRTRISSIRRGSHRLRAATAPASAAAATAATRIEVVRFGFTAPDSGPHSFTQFTHAHVIIHSQVKWLVTLNTYTVSTTLHSRPQSDRDYFLYQDMLLEINKQMNSRRTSSEAR